jgi:large subunit ribosomal protein L22
MDNIFSDIVIEEPEAPSETAVVKEKRAIARKSKLDTSMQKLKEVCSQVQGLRVEEAIRQLEFSPRKMAKEVLKAVKMARNNARCQGIPGENLVVSHLIIDRATPLKRVMPHAKGRRGTKLHRRSSLTVRLDDLYKLKGKKWEYIRLKEQVKQKYAKAGTVSE